MIIEYVYVLKMSCMHVQDSDAGLLKNVSEGKY